MRAIVLKNHYEHIVRARLHRRQAGPRDRSVRRRRPEPDGWRHEPAAIRCMAATTGGRGKLVWMSTFDAENQSALLEREPAVRQRVEKRPAPAGDEGSHRPSIASHGLVLATGHVLAGRRADAGARSQTTGYPAHRRHARDERSDPHDRAADAGGREDGRASSSLWAATSATLTARRGWIALPMPSRRSGRSSASSRRTSDRRAIRCRRKDSAAFIGAMKAHGLTDQRDRSDGAPQPGAAAGSFTRQ